MHINFNSLSLGLAGGTRFIFELANSLVDKNQKVTITHLGDKSVYCWVPELKAEVINVQYVPHGPASRGFSKVFAKSMKKYGYGSLSDRERRLMEIIPECDVNVATFCWTAAPTYYSGKGRRFYLVQNYEPWFFDDVKTQERAALTYTLPLKKLCVSKWLTEKVGGVNVGNGINLSQFKQQKTPKLYDVMVIQRTSGWKGDYLAVIEALGKLGLKVFVAGGGVSEADLVSAYNASRIFLFLSKFEGFGYPPLEAMACGTPVITTSCLEFATHLSNAYVLKQDYTVNDVLDAVDQLFKDDALYERLVQSGLKTAQAFDFQKVVKRFLETVKPE
jgi:glycosyltransferase involved in cell wall biosynthesis